MEIWILIHGQKPTELTSNVKTIHQISWWKCKSFQKRYWVLIDLMSQPWGKMWETLQPDIESFIWDKVFKSGLSKFFKSCLPQNLLSPLLNALSHLVGKYNFSNN